MDSVVFLYLPSVWHEDENNSLLRLGTLIDHSDEVTGLMRSVACCLDPKYNRYYFFRDSCSWTRELDVELKHWLELDRFHRGGTTQK